MTEQTLRPYNQTWNDRLASYLYDHTSGSPEARQFVGGMFGSTGLGKQGMGLVDAVPGVGQALNFQDAYQHQDPKGMAMAALPIAPKPMQSYAGAVERFAADELGALIPKNTVSAYKLFRTKGDGELYPLFVKANDRVPMNEWVDAEVGPMVGDKVKSKLGPLAYRPGWHGADLPLATHIGGKSMKGIRKPDYRPDNQVWAEVEMPNDVDWQSEALARAEFNKRGKIIPRTAHITDQVPLGGFYRYKTNPNMTGNWMIGGGMKVNRILHPDEVREINNAAGVSDLPSLAEVLRARGM